MRRSPSMVIPITGVIVGAAVVVYAILSRTHVTHGKIGTTTLSDRWQPVDVEGAPRTKRIGSFAELAWATSIATRWRSDATLFKMFGTDVGDDGWTTLSGANTSYVEYTFESPSCWSAAGTSPDTCGLNLLLDAPGGHVRVQADEYERRGSLRAVGPVTCTLSQALAALAKAEPLVVPPFRVALDNAGTSKWTFFDTKGEVSDPSVGATSCAVTSVQRASAAERCIVPLAPSASLIPKPAGSRCPRDETGPYDLPRAHVVFPDAAVTVNVEVARTADERKRGLFYRASLPEGNGMLFVGERKVQHFWMHAACIPLDMLFIDDDGLIVGVAENAPVLDDGDQSVACTSRYVLAVNAGWVRRHGVRPGQRVTLPP
ncbi:MAG TPA: DUF192 domain-containing protein [Polyangiaceae bacterium]